MANDWRSADADRLIVVLGAGASADSTSHHVPGVNPSRTPPLVRELFDNRFDAILNQYPLGQFAAADIRRLAADSFSIEQFLRERYAGNAHELVRRKFLSLPLYLQQMLLQVSWEYTP